MIMLTETEFDLFQTMIEKECGIALQKDKQYLVESRLMNLVVEAGCETFKDFYAKINSSFDKTIKDKIIDAMTTNETLWFRDESPYTLLREKLYPEFFNANKPCRIWSAACSTGQEPYSMTMVADEYANKKGIGNKLPQLLSIMATDISSSALLIAKTGRYNPIAMSRGMKPEYKGLYFDEDKNTCVIKDKLKQFIEFKKFNLQESFQSIGKSDIVFLRNVAIYFSHDFKVELFRKIANNLNPGGYLVLGSSETLMGYSEDYDLLEHDRCRYYQVKSSRS